MNPKQQHNRSLYIKALRAMSPEQRLRKAFELTEFSRELFKQGLRRARPNLSEEELHSLYLKRLARCHNRNY
jgi:hypothetical protein